MICFGHRGAMGHVAENTLESFELAVRQGANSIELDVIQIEGQAVVFHDSSLERLCGVSGLIENKSLKEISTLRVQNKHKIPMLSEVFDLINGKVGINIELKTKGSATAVYNTIKTKNYNIDDLLISSFNHKELKEIKILIPAIKIGALHVSIPVENAKFANELSAYSVHPSIEFIDKDYVTDAHQRGLKVFVFTVNTVEDFQRMKDLAVDGVFTNYPDKFFKAFTKVNSKF
jgi:glycerophosphoryl diester phosphodiesterase